MSAASARSVPGSTRTRHSMHGTADGRCRRQATRAEHDGGAVAAAGAPDAGAGERRRAGQVEARHGGLVAGQLGVAAAQGGERAAAEAGGVARPAGGSRARRRPGSSPASRRSTRGTRARSAVANSSSQRRGSAEPAQPPGSAYGVRRTSTLSTWRPGGAIVGSAIDGTLTRRAGRSRTPPVASIAAARSISATVGASVNVGRQVDARCRAGGVRGRRRRRSSTRSRLRPWRRATARSSRPRRRGRATATPRTCGAGRTPTRRSSSRSRSRRPASRRRRGRRRSARRVTVAPVRTSPPRAHDGRGERLGQGAAAADRSADAPDVAHRVRQRAEPGPGRLRADAPHHRPERRAPGRRGRRG